MNLIHKYYASIIGIIRFLGIGVGNEHARAAAIMSVTMFALIFMLAKFLKFDLKQGGILAFVGSTLLIYFGIYWYFNKNERTIEMNNWLVKSSKSEKLPFYIFSVLLFLLSLLTILKVQV